MAMQMPKITECQVTQCSYNQNRQCHTMAITVGGPEDQCACCDTYFDAGQKGGIPDLTGSVGACKANSCEFNRSFECSAPGIQVGMHSGHADCTTFRPR